MFDRDQMISDLKTDEGFRDLLYDDASDKLIGPGVAVQGNPTIGYGWCVSKTPLTPEQYEIILGWLLDAKTGELYRTFPWLETLSEPRQRAVADMAYQMGVHGLSAFATFLGFLQSGQFNAAADDVQATPWYRQSGDRAKRIEQLIRTG